MYHPAGGADDTLEWIELHNQMAVDMDISNWSLDGGVQLDFPDGTEIPGRSYLVIAADPNSLETVSGITGVLGPFNGNLSNGGEQLRLLNNDDRLMNVVDYNDTGDWPSGADGGGVSLVKFNEATNSELAKNWTISPQQGGTPGAKNFEADPDPIPLTFIEPGAGASVLVPGNGNLGLSWTQPGFTPTAWTNRSHRYRLRGSRVHIGGIYQPDRPWGLVRFLRSPGTRFCGQLDPDNQSIGGLRFQC